MVSGSLSGQELCRLLARLKANFQLAELVQCANYAEWIGLVATFTVDSFKVSMNLPWHLSGPGRTFAWSAPLRGPRAALRVRGLLDVVLLVALGVGE